MSIPTSILSPLKVGGSLGKPWMAAVLGVATFCVGAVQAQSLFGNLGADGSGSLANTNTDIGATASPETYIAQGIVAGSVAIGSVTLGLYGDGNQPASVSIYGDASGEPGKTALFTSASVTVNAKDKYTFNFAGGAALTTGMPYWIVPNGSVSWYFAGGGFLAAPTAQNGSDYFFAQTMSSPDKSTFSWTGTAPGYSININPVPVPEPASMGIAGLALVGAAVALRRRGAAAK